MVEKLDIEEIMDRLSEYEGWTQQGITLTKQFEFEDFSAALAFVNDVGEIAEDMEHHPDIALQNYNQVLLRISTHDVNAITDKDVTFVDRVEEVLWMAEDAAANGAKNALKGAVEQLSEERDAVLELRNRICDLVEEHDIHDVNDLPFLYRMEIKRILEEEDYHHLARQITV